MLRVFNKRLRSREDQEDQEILPDHHHQNLLSRQECAPPKYHKLGLQLSESVTFGFVLSSEKESIPHGYTKNGEKLPSLWEEMDKSSVNIDG